jgi:hypothetical protein
MARLIGLLAIALLLVGCEKNTVTYRYKLTLTVEDNGTHYSGSSVVQVKTWDSQTIDQGNMFHTQSTGQATIVDLGQGRVLFGLLTGGYLQPLYRDEPIWRDGPTNLIVEAFGNAWSRPNGKLPVGLATYPGAGAKDLAPEKLPSLVTFRDASDPRTVVKVDPTNLESAFGPGVKLTSATIEITDDPITNGITKRLPWLVGRRGYIDGGFTDAGTPFTGNQFANGVR